MNRAERRSRGQRGSLIDTRIAYGARCTWWDSIDQVATNEGGLPCCPHCGSVLFEVPTLDEWFAGVNKQAETEPGYREFIEWARSRCFPNFEEAKAAFAGAQS